MKTTTKIAIALLLILGLSCKKEDKKPYTGKVEPVNPKTPEEINEPYKIKYAHATFWTKEPVVLVTVSINDNHYFGSQQIKAPECQDSTVHWASLIAGTYNYTAEDYYGRKFSGSFTVSEGECLTVELK